MKTFLNTMYLCSMSNTFRFSFSQTTNYTFPVYLLVYCVTDILNTSHSFIFDYSILAVLRNDAYYVVLYLKSINCHL